MPLTTPIKLFVDAHVFDGEYQGSRTFINDLYNELSQSKELELYVGAYDVENLKRFFTGNQNIRFIKYRSRSAWVRLTYDIPAIIRKNNIDYAHFQYIVPLLKNCKFIVTTHDVLFNEYPEEFSYWFRKGRNFLYRRAARKADILTTDSTYSRNSIRKYLGIDPAHINVISPGIAKACFAPYDKKEAQNFIKDKYGIDKFILFVSRFEPRKNHTMLLKAWIDLKLYDKGYWLVLLGNKCQRIREFDQVLESLPDNIRSFIYIDGRSDNETLIQFYRAAAVFVYPSKGEGFGLPPLEAAAARTPVLCSNTSAMSDFVFFLKNHIDPANVDLFRSGLSKILDADPDSDQLNKISDFISYTYSPAKAADSLLRLIKEDAASTGKN